MTARHRSNGARCSDSVRLVELAALHFGIPCEILDVHSGYLCRVGEGPHSILIGGGNVSSWPLNNATASSIATDKGFTALVLAEKGISIPNGTTVFLSERFALLRDSGRELTDVAALVRKIGWPIIAKPNNGARGAFVRLCEDEQELLTHLKRMGERYDIGLIQEYVEGWEYRVFVFDDRAIFCFRKERGTIVGDGEHSVAALIDTLSARLIGHGLDPIDPDSKTLRDQMHSNNLNMQSILANGLTLEVGVRANLSAGGVPASFSTEVPAALADTARRATRAVGLMVAGIDLIVPKGAEESPVVIEVNSNPALTSLEKVGRTDIAIDLFGQVFERLLAKDRSK